MIKLFLLLLVVYSSSLFAEEKRPTVGLVLSGGGARGAAHLGVIKAFEKHHIPIDAIVGTSMGAFVGGLYASGVSSAEIEEMLISKPWKKIIAQDYERKNIPFRRKTLERDFAADAKLGINSKNEIALAPGLFKKQGILNFLKDETYGVRSLESFDQLKIPFRSVASRLRDGACVVLSKGSLAEALYASLAIPGGFEPIEIDGEMLVDGGVANNLPIDVMREEMKVDYIVVVDITTPYDNQAEFNDYFSVTGQLINILMRKNVEQSLSSMKGRKNEILLTPNLKGYTPLDIEKYPEIIAIGQETAEEAYGTKLAALSLEPAVYVASYEQQQSKKVQTRAPVIDKIEVVNGTYLNEKKILSYLHVKEGEILDEAQLEADIVQIYSLMIFDEVSYKIDKQADKMVLKIITTPSWDVNGQFRFSFGFEDNMKGHNDYFVKFEYIKFGLNAYAGEWRSRLALGKKTLLSTEFYQPLDPYDTFYIRPSVFYKDEKVYVTPSIIGDHSIQADLDQTVPFQTKEYGGALGLGVNLSNNLRLEVSGELKEVRPSTSILIENNASRTLTDQEAKARVFKTKVGLEYDNLDDPFFPTRGAHVTAWVKKSEQTNNTKDVDYKQYFSEVTGAMSLGKHTLIPKVQLGESFNVEGSFDDVQDFGSFFTLGGLFSLSGLPTNAVTGNNVAFASLLYRYRLSEQDFFGSLSVPLYIGMSAETGTTWYGDAAFSRDKLLYSGSVYMAADTILGPFYIGFGSTEFDYYSLYISLGKSF